MIDSQVVAFALVAAVLTLTPGPDTMLVVRNVLRGGRRDGVVTTLGICLGLFVHAVLSGVGVSVVLMHSTTAFFVVKVAGACYLVWLGIQSLSGAVAGGTDVADASRSVPAAVVSPRRCFVEGMLGNLLNPKVAVFYVAFLPQFIGPTDAVLRKALLLAGIHYVEGVVWLVTVAMLVDRMRQFFIRSPVRRWLDGVCGTLLVGFGVRLALERR
jgi:RhtB (resistance to homoserine/threonine) family protein